MISDSTDAKVLAQEQWTLEQLARETRTPLERVQAAFLCEYNRLSENARVTSFLPLLARNSTRLILDAENASREL
jgi:hypothetical protein